MSSNNILHLIDHPGAGGAQTIVDDLLAEDENAYCYALREKGELQINSERVKTRQTDSKWDIISIPRILQEIENKDIDILHCHLQKASILGTISKIICRKRIKLIIHEHGEIYTPSRMYKWFLKLNLSRIDKIIAVSQTTKSKLMNKLDAPEEKIEILTNYVNLEKFNPELKNNHNLDNPNIKQEENLIFSFAGRLVERKGWETLISAFKQNSFDNTRLIIAGKGPDQEKMRSKIQEAENIIYLGFIEDIRDLYGSTDCFIIPSHWDPSPMTLFETQASNIPIICSDAPSLNEFVQNNETALVFEKKDAKDLANKITEMKNNPDIRHKLRTKGLQNIRENHGFKDYKTDLEKIYNEVAK